MYRCNACYTRPYSICTIDHYQFERRSSHHDTQVSLCRNEAPHHSRARIAFRHIPRTNIAHARRSILQAPASCNETPAISSGPSLRKPHLQFIPLPQRRARLPQPVQAGGMPRDVRGEGAMRRDRADPPAKQRRGVRLQAVGVARLGGVVARRAVARHRDHGRRAVEDHAGFLVAHAVAPQVVAAALSAPTLFDGHGSGGWRAEGSALTRPTRAPAAERASTCRPSWRPGRCRRATRSGSGCRWRC